MNVPLPPPITQPFVYIIDSPSSNDLYKGYSIGMALRDTLKAISIPCVYRLVTNKESFDKAMTDGLREAINEFQVQANIHSYPFIHFCMHGNLDGVGLTDTTFINWQQLRQSLVSHNFYKGYNPYVCMASCNGFDGTKMASAFDPAFAFLIGNTATVRQSDLTVAYMSFYNHIFFRQATFDQAVHAMRSASGDHNFYYDFGENIKNQKLALVNNQAPCT